MFLKYSLTIRLLMLKNKEINNSVYLPEVAEVVSTQQLTDMEKYIELKFKEPGNFDFNPGQFIQVSIFGIGEAPISISSSPFNKNTIGICVRKAGDVTSAIHQLEKGSYLGTNATTLEGVTLGGWCIVGIGSVVIRDIPPMTIAAGNPAKVIRERAFETFKK